MAWYSEARDSRDLGFSGSRTMMYTAIAVFTALALILIATGTDEAISRKIIAWTANNPTAYGALNGLSDLYEIKGVIAAMVLWWLWSQRGEDGSLEHRFGAAAVYLVAVCAIVVGRLTANFLPFRPRPMSDPEVAGAYLKSNSFFQDWSSFPSDHAILYGAFAAAVIHLAPRLGWWLLVCHAVLLVALPRVLVGKHYLSDILAGIALGAWVGWMLMPPLKRWVARLWARMPSSWGRVEFVYPGLFLVCFELATNFDGARRVLRMIASVIV